MIPTDAMRLSSNSRRSSYAAFSDPTFRSRRSQPDRGLLYVLVYLSLVPMLAAVSEQNVLNFEDSLRRYARGRNVGDPSGRFYFFPPASFSRS
jgi:hypothetical protein